MSQQVILAVDDDGKFLEYISKEAGHKGKGKRHLAITVLLYNSQGQVLLQKRKHQIFDNVWDFTGATHPLHKIEGADESLIEATLRCLRVEWGISEVKSLSEKGVFNYSAQDKEYSENEYCYLMVGEYEGEVKLDPEVGYEYKWMSKREFLKDVQNNPQNYAPWVIEGVKLL